MTEPNLDKILRRIAYWNGYDSAGEISWAIESLRKADDETNK